MNTKHTPGPWHRYAAPAVDIHIGPCVGSHAGDRLANVIYRGDSAQSNADAALIAAAPDMLATMSALLADLDSIGFERDDDDVAGTECVDTVSQHIERIRAAIAKATGVQS